MRAGGALGSGGLAVLLAGGAALLSCATGGARGPVDVVEASIAELREAILTGRITCRDVVRAHLDRIRAYDTATGLNAITEVNPRALEEADALEAALADGAEPGPLHCAPLLVKDNMLTPGIPTTAGSVALAGYRPAGEAFVVRRLREAGAIVLAKTNMAEWAISPRQTLSSSYGRTANAYALDRTSAGSSGGTASGVAASFGVAGLGTDTGNSIRGPSAHLALVGVRPTLGLVSRAGIVPLAFDRDVAGPMARSVEDAARLFDVLAGPDPADPYTELGRGRRAPDYTAFLDPAGLRGRRVAVLGQLMDAVTPDTAVQARFAEALDDLRRLGAEVVEDFEVPGLDALIADAPFCPRFRHDLRAFLRAAGGAPISDLLEVLDAGAFDPDSEDAIRQLAGVPGDGPEPPCPEFPDHPGRQALRAAVVDALDDAGIDAFVFPTWGDVPASIDRANEEYRGDYSQRLIPAAGLPAITVPMGFTYDRYPAGLQIAGRPFAEGLLFRLAYAYEQGTRHRRPPPDFPPL